MTDHGMVPSGSGLVSQWVHWLREHGEELPTGAWYPCGNHSTKHSHSHRAVRMEFPVSGASTVYSSTSQGHEAAAVRAELHAGVVQEAVPWLSGECLRALPWPSFPEGMSTDQVPRVIPEKSQLLLTT